MAVLHFLCNLLFPRYFSYSFLLSLCSNCGAEQEKICLKVVTLSWFSCPTNHLLIVTSVLHWFQLKDLVLKLTGVRKTSLQFSVFNDSLCEWSSLWLNFRQTLRLF